MIPDPSGQLTELIVYITSTRIDLYSHQILLKCIFTFLQNNAAPKGLRYHRGLPSPSTNIDFFSQSYHLKDTHKIFKNACRFRA